MLQVMAAHLEALRVLSIREDRRSAAGGMGQRSKTKPQTHLQQQPLFLVPDLSLHLFVQMTDLAVVRRCLPVMKQGESRTATAWRFSCAQNCLCVCHRT